MEDKKNCPELEEDEELATLRLAALATLKSRPATIPEKTTDVISNILPINSIARVNKDFSSEHGSHKNKNSWRNNSQSSKRKGKSSQRSSNLIVITPVGSENKQTSNEKPSQLLLPQHKWLHQTNEDSSSPKTDRRTGPSRFNRHGSESESSDSDYDESDDSFSNDTILQDERSRLSPPVTNHIENNIELSNNRSSDHRLSFQNLDTNLRYDNNNRTENTDDNKGTETEFSASHVNDVPLPIKNECGFVASLQNNSSHNDHNRRSEEKLDAGHSELPSVRNNGEIDVTSIFPDIVKPKNKHTPIKFDLNTSSNQKSMKVPISEPREKSREVPLEYKTVQHPVDNKLTDSYDHKSSSLSKNDLRFELKRKKATINKIDSPGKNNKPVDAKLSPNKIKTHNHFRSWSTDRSSSSEKKSFKRSWSRDRSRTPDGNRRRSRDRSHSPSRKRRRSREYSRKSSRRRPNRELSSSRSSSSSSSRSSSISSGSSDKRKPRSISSVVKPLQSKVVVSDNSLKTSVNRKSSPDNDLVINKSKDIEFKLKSMPSIKVSVPGNDQRNNVSEIKKRGPVHMRLGTLNRKRIIQMPKDVEAAFVTTSSDDDNNDVNNKCKKQNIVVVTKVKQEYNFSHYPEKNILSRSEVPKSGKGRIFR